MGSRAVQSEAIRCTHVRWISGPGRAKCLRVEFGPRRAQALDRTANFSPGTRMEEKSDLGRSLADALARVTLGILRVTFTLVDIVFFSILAMLAPFLSIALIVLCLIGLGICLLYGVIAHTPHFSMPLMLGFSAA